MPASVIEYAARLLPHMAPDLGVPVSVRDDPGHLDIVQRSADELPAALASRVTAELRSGPGSIGVIAPDTAIDRSAGALDSTGVTYGRLDRDHGDQEDHPVQLVPATVAKGLEFDTVIVVEPGAIAAAEPDPRTGLRRLYVVLTRAVSALVVLHSEPLPAELA